MPGEWLTKQEAADFIGRSPRRLLEVAVENGIPIQEQKVRGARIPQKRFELAALKRYKAQRDAPRPATITITKQLETPDGAAPTALVVAPKNELERLHVAEGAVKLDDTLRASVEATARAEALPNRWLTLKEASLILGLSRKLLAAACASGRLAFVQDGRQLMVRYDDLRALRF